MAKQFLDLLFRHLEKKTSQNDGLYGWNIKNHLKQTQVLCRKKTQPLTMVPPCDPVSSQCRGPSAIGFVKRFGTAAWIMTKTSVLNTKLWSKGFLWFFSKVFWNNNAVKRLIQSPSWNCFNMSYRSPTLRLGNEVVLFPALLRHALHKVDLLEVVKSWWLVDLCSFRSSSNVRISKLEVWNFEIANKYINTSS